MDLTRGPEGPAERITAAFNLVLAVAWMTLTPAGAAPPWPVAMHVALAALPWLLGRAGAGNRLHGTLRDLYPLALFAVFWSELGALHTLDSRTRDAVIAALDLRLFGVHWSAVWMPAMPQVWLSELMHASYVGYYAMVLVPPVAFACTGNRPALRDFVLRLSATYAACFTAYLLFPVLGPGRTMPHYTGLLTTGFFYHLSHAAHAAGDAAGTAFPSSHVAGAMAVAWSCWQSCRRPVAWAVALQTLIVTAATIYTQNHYPVDVLGGIAVALLLQLAIVPRIARAFSWSPAAHAAGPAPLPGHPRTNP